MLLLLPFFFLILSVYGHGRLLVPATRVGHDNYENDPTGSSGNGGNNNDAWVCRHASPNPNVARTTVNAGQTLNLQWHFSAKHVGDCDAYISYDVDSPLSQMNWFKLGNFFDCRVDSDREVNHPLVMPSMLKSGNAVLRWGWYALHQHPNVEFYSQCSDITIVGGQANLDSQVVTYPLIGANPVFPLRADDGVGYANRFPPVVEWMTGPPCAYGIPDATNDCYRTAKGTQGYIDVGQNDVTGTGTTSTSSASGGASTTSPALTTSTIRCGSAWLDADSKCGTPCVDNGDCTVAGETCFKDLQTCSEVGVTNACTTWVKLDNRPGIPEGWCQTTCTNAETQRYCDSDSCQCAEIEVDGVIFSAQGNNDSFSSSLATLLAIFIALYQF